MERRFPKTPMFAITAITPPSSTTLDRKMGILPQDVVGKNHNLLQGVPCPRGLGFDDLDLGSSPGWWAATVATYCPSRMVEHPKSKSTKPPGSRCRIL